jgi:hypothetical protein
VVPRDSFCALFVTPVRGLSKVKRLRDAIAGALLVWTPTLVRVLADGVLQNSSGYGSAQIPLSHDPGLPI